MSDKIANLTTESFKTTVNAATTSGVPFDMSRG